MIDMDKEENKDGIDLELQIEEKPESKALSPDEGISQLQDQLAAEIKAREKAEADRDTAENRAYTTEQDNYRLRGEAQNNDLQTITSAIEMVRSKQENTKTALKKALVDGDVDSIADLQEEIAKNANSIAQLEAGKEAIENKPKNTPNSQNDDAVESLAKQLSSRSARWVRDHPEYARDPKKYQAMIGAHNVAIGNGISVDSDEYFSEIERVLGVSSPASKQNDDEDPLKDAAKTTSRRSSLPPAAPASRSASTPGNKSNVVRLSAAEREMASDLGMTEEEYAKNKMDLVRQGRMN